MPSVFFFCSGNNNLLTDGVINCQKKQVGELGGNAAHCTSVLGLADP